MLLIYLLTIRAVTFIQDISDNYINFMNELSEILFFHKPNTEVMLVRDFNINLVKMHELVW